MKLLKDIEKKAKKTQVITIRVNDDTLRKIAELKEKYNISQTDLVEHLIDVAYQEDKESRKRKK